MSPRPPFVHEYRRSLFTIAPGHPAYFTPSPATFLLPVLGGAVTFIATFAGNNIPRVTVATIGIGFCVGLLGVLGPSGAVKAAATLADLSARGVPESSICLSEADDNGRVQDAYADAPLCARPGRRLRSLMFLEQAARIRSSLAAFVDSRVASRQGQPPSTAVMFSEIRTWCNTVVAYLHANRSLEEAGDVVEGSAGPSETGYATKVGVSAEMMFDTELTAVEGLARSILGVAADHHALVST